MGLLSTPRINEEIENQLKILSETIDLKDALLLMVDLVGKVRTEKQVTKYDTDTGKPIFNTGIWEPNEIFDDNFTFGGISYGGSIDVKLTELVVSKIKGSPVVFEKNGIEHVAMFEEKDHSGYDRGASVHCIEHLIKIVKVRKI